MKIYGKKYMHIHWLMQFRKILMTVNLKSITFLKNNNYPSYV